jgi:hypothetical protein
MSMLSRLSPRRRSFVAGCLASLCLSLGALSVSPIPAQAAATHAVRGTSPRLLTHWGVELIALSGGTYFYANNYVRIGKSHLIMQGDGNFVLYDENGRARWATNTVGRGAYATFQTDGNLVVYDAAGRPVWASNTCCRSGLFFAVQADGNLVIYDNNWGVYWTTNTHH